MFELKDVRFKQILDLPHLIIDHPVTCIVGASGSGKTTLLRHLNKLYVPDQGEIWYQGEAMSGLDPVQLRRRVVMLGQTPVLYDGTVEDNLQIGLRFAQRLPADREALEEALARVGLKQGLDDWCDKLSGGEKARLCLARVMLMDAETYLLDEPSSALDAETEAFVIDRLVQYTQGRGRQIIIVTHSDRVAGRYPDSCIRLENGRAEGYT